MSRGQRHKCKFGVQFLSPNSHSSKKNVSKKVRKCAVRSRKKWSSRPLGVEVWRDFAGDCRPSPFHREGHCCSGVGSSSRECTMVAAQTLASCSLALAASSATLPLPSFPLPPKSLQEIAALLISAGPESSLAAAAASLSACCPLPHARSRMCRVFSPSSTSYSL